MGQKTHPIGFRLGVNSQCVMAYQEAKDLHGHTSRWAIGNCANVNNYSDLSQRDRLIKNIIEQFLEEDGYITNKCIVTRTQTYVGIYVDALELDEPSYSHQSIDRVTYENIEVGMKNLELKISKNIEHGMPVNIQFVTLDPKVEADDLSKAIILLTKHKIPCCNLIAKMIAIKMTQGGREREAMRTILKLMQNLEIKGYFMRLKGRIGGSERSRIVRNRQGPMPRHTIAASIDYGFSEVNSASGKISVTFMAYI